jgi:hypothetical protein
MGLHPSPEATFPNEVFREFDTLARAACVGLLDWRTLVAWIFNWHLAVERRLEDVDASRRFGFTDYYRDEERLGERIEEIQAVAASLGGAAGYDRGNNVGPVPLPAVEQGKERDGGGDGPGEEEDPEEEELEYEEEPENGGAINEDDQSVNGGESEGEEEDDDNNNEMGVEYQSDTEEDSDFNNFVRGGPPELPRSYDDPSTDNDGVVVMTDAGRTTAPKRSRNVDELWFLEGY